MKIWLLLIRDDTKTSLMQSVSSISESSAIFTQMHYSWMQFEESIHQHFRPDIGAEVLINFRLDFFNRCPMSEFKQVLLFNFSSIWLDWFLFGFLETNTFLASLSSFLRTSFGMLLLLKRMLLTAFSGDSLVVYKALAHNKFIFCYT